MKIKLFFALVLVPLVLGTSIPRVNASAQSDAAAKAVDALLQQTTQSEWSLMALAAAGKASTLDASVVAETLENFDATVATDVEKTIMAIVAMEKNPHTYFAKGDIVNEFLKTFFDGIQLGDAQQLNDDAWGMIALAASGMADTDATMQTLAQHLRTTQHADGGWGITVDTAQLTDTDNTAAVVMALRAAGVVASDAALQSAISFFHTQQNNDGGFRGYDDTTSNTDSTTWALAALNSLGEDLDNWKPGGKSPVDFIVALQASDGTFYWKAGSATKASTPFAVVALLGQTFPVKIFLAMPQIQFRIEGADAQICSGSVLAETAMDVIVNAATTCGYTYELREDGTYLDSIDNDSASGMTGWLYLVNWKQGTTAATDAQLQNGDDVLWYYGEYDWLPLQLTLSATNVQDDQTVEVLVESFDGARWRPESGATVLSDAATFVTNADGRTTLTSLEPGVIVVIASKDGFVRSQAVSLHVGESSPAIDLYATIDIPERTPQGEPEIAFTVSSNPIDFGTLQPGTTSHDHDVIIENTGQLPIYVGAEVTGDTLFVDHILLNAASWASYLIALETDSGQVADVALAVSSDYTQEGARSGQLIFWAQAE